MNRLGEHRGSDETLPSVFKKRTNRECADVMGAKILLLNNG
jgi:hypothetical protein